ncbi:MAG: hypothetical protein D6708_11500, partial [Candidatus Dadabacteria bacterium]
MVVRPRLLPLTLALVLLAASLAARPAAAADRLVVLPFEIYNAPDLDALKPGLEAALASRLDGPGYTVTRAHEARPEDWTVRTTVTRLGPTYSLDAALVPPEGAAAEGTRSYRTVKAPEELLGALEAVAGELRQHLLRHAQGGPSPAPVPAAPAPPAPAPGRA